MVKGGAKGTGRAISKGIGHTNNHLAGKGLIPEHNSLNKRQQARTKLHGDDHIEGFLLKKGMHARRNWKMRFFILQGADLTYYEDKTSHKSKGSVKLSNGCKIEQQQAVIAGKGRVPVRWPETRTKEVPSFFFIKWDGNK